MFENGWDYVNNTGEILRQLKKSFGFQNELKWQMVFSITAFHVLGLYWSIYHAFPVKWQTIVFAMAMFVISGIGITCGVHRLWTHRCFKATLPLRVWLLISFASAGQNSVYEWVRDHRLHHKYSDTEADPHNAKRGLFFSHIGWLMMKKNDLVLQKGKQIDLSDIENDPLLMWEKKHSTKLSLLFCYFLPTIVGIYLWGETWQCAVAWQCFIRVLAVFHSEMTVNSLAHAFGSRPYNKNIMARQNIFVATCTFGEGAHNYHHIFPYDYRADETFDLFNLSTRFIRYWHIMGLAYDLKEPTEAMVQTVTERLRKENVDMKKRPTGVMDDVWRLN